MASPKTQIQDTLVVPILEGAHSTTPSNPASGFSKAYFKNDGNLYSLDSGGTEVIVGTGAVPSTPVVASITNGDSPYTITPDVGTVLCNATSGAITVNLPTAVGIPSTEYLIKKTDSTFNLVTIDGNGTETIDGALTKKLATQNESIKVISDGTNWQIVERRIPSEVIAFTPTGRWSTNVTWTGFWKRTGDSIRVTFKVAATGATEVDTFATDLPSGLTIDTAKVSVENGYTSIGRAYGIDATGTDFWYEVVLGGSTTEVFTGLNRADTTYVSNNGSADNGTPFTIASGDSYGGEYTVPITNWEG